jgi:coenzyme F420-dependent glucose-6-phosphate dehydrogenase
MSVNEFLSAQGWVDEETRWLNHRVPAAQVISTRLLSEEHMVLFSYHASHEQFAPSALVHYARLAEQAGFTAISSSDHFQPWSSQQGESGFAWAWLGAAMQATALPFSVVCAPGQRYHPVLIAQAAATLAEMFPGRFRLALGSGEALNERVIGDAWPPKAERNARLVECVQVIRALWAGETVTHDGRVRVETARLYTRPAVPPAILGAAITSVAGLMACSR